MKKYRYFFISIIVFVSFHSVQASSSVGTIDDTYKTTKICQDTTCISHGNINWKPTLNANTPGATAVIITDSGITGHIWGDEIGWVELDPTGAGVSVDPNTGVLSGKAFANTGSWINFSPTGEGVTLVDNGSGSNFSGYAFVSGAGGGWMKFDCASDSTCIKTDWRVIASRSDDDDEGGGGGGGGGGGENPPPVIPPENPYPPSDSPSGPPTENPGDGEELPPPTPPSQEPGSPPVGEPGDGEDDGGSPNTGGPSFGFPDVLSSLKKIPSSLENFTERPSVKTSKNLAVLIPALISAIALIGSLASGIPLVNYLLYLIAIISQLLGMKEPAKPWGVVYDSYSKRPIPFSRVEILNAESRKLQSTIADVNGRYGFLVSSQEGAPESMQIKSFQHNYLFPSREEPTETERMLYPNIYKGGPIDTSKGTMNFDLPMSPEDKSSINPFYFRIVSMKLNNFLTNLADVLFVLGAAFAIMSYLVDSSNSNLFILLAVIITYVLRKSGLKLKPFGLTKDASTNNVLPFGFVGLHGEDGERVNFTVSDNNGRYFLLSPKGKYLLKAYTPSHITPMRTKEISIYTERGWVSREITL